MKSFALDENGDLLIKNGEIQMVSGAELTQQKVKTVLSTNKGEWSLNVDEGIDFKNILGKSNMKLKGDKQQVLESENAYLKGKLQDYENNNEMNDLLERRLDGES